MRYHLVAGVAALALAACSGGNEPPAPQPSETVAATEAAPTGAADEAVVETPTPTESATPEPTESAAPAPTPTPTPAPTPTKAAAAPAPAPVPVAAAEPPKAFARCAVCHNAAKGAGDKLGPNLWGTYGHKMGQGSFAFSDALKNSGLTMDEATLDQWLENPRALVPGNRMSFPGLKDPAKRKEIIDYLKTLK